jgi:hypothetical protein
MEPTIALIIAIPLAALAIAAVIYASRRRRTEELRHRFGPEYDRALAAGRPRRDVEQELLRRQERAGRLRIRALDDSERLGFAESWAALQRRFVDDPTGAVRDAHRLLEELMVRRGYPTNSFDEEVELLSVNHPAAVQHYRAAHVLHHQRRTGDAGPDADPDAGTELNRQAMIHYRALFEELLEVPGQIDERAAHRAEADARGQSAPAA